MAGVKGRSGRKPKAVGFRQWCRDVVMQPEVLEAMKTRAKTDTDFALKLSEHGFGRPPQALDVKVAGGSKPLRFELPGSGDLPAAVTGVSVGGTD